MVEIVGVSVERGTLTPERAVRPVKHNRNDFSRQ
jgi:hypothetical protein